MARLSVMKDGLVVVFYSSAIKLCIDDFKSLIQEKEIPFQTAPKGHEDNAREDLLNTVLKKYDFPFQIQFLVSKTDWKTYKKKLDGLTRALYNAQQRKMQ